MVYDTVTADDRNLNLFPLSANNSPINYLTFSSVALQEVEYSERGASTDW